MSEQLSNQEKADKVREYEAHTTGSRYLHNHWTWFIKYTDGAKFVADTCDAHWLLDVIASHQLRIRAEHQQLVRFQVWLLKKVTKDGLDSWVAEAWSDTPGRSGGDDGPPSVLLAQQHIPWVDFPDELLPFESLWVRDGVLMMKREN